MGIGGAPGLLWEMGIMGARQGASCAEKGLTYAVGAIQVFYRTSSQTTAQVLSTNQTSAELQLPSMEDYIIQVKATTAGGDGASSKQIRVPGISRKSGEGGQFHFYFSQTLYRLRRPGEQTVDTGAFDPDGTNWE